MKRQTRHLLLFIAIVIGLVTAENHPIQAQETAVTPPPPFLVITASRADSPPAVDVILYGITAQGDALPISSDTVAINHNNTPAASVIRAGSETVGTFTLFLIDLPPGVSTQSDVIATAIKGFAAAPTMQEQLDSAAIYQVGETAALQVMAPSAFHNDIQNTFASPIAPAAGATALVDSIASLLAQINTLKPNPAMAASIVIFSDGTDVVSSTALDAIAPQAAALGIPLHTIWLENENLPLAGQQIGQDYLAQIAAESRGRAALLSDATAVSAIWTQITSFREQTILRYTLPDISGGSYTVTASLKDQPSVQAETTGTLPTNLPSVDFTVPAESRTLALPNLDNPVTLRLGAVAGWLDGESRELVAASLLVNETKVADIDVSRLDNFTVEIPALAYGDNRFNLVVLDNQGLRATSPTLTLTVNEGPRDIPEALQAGGGFGSFLQVLLLLLVAVFGLIVGLFLAWRQGWLGPVVNRLPRGRRERPQSNVSITDENGRPVGRPAAPAPGNLAAYLEVLATDSPVASRIPLRQTVVKIGRSPAQSDIAFENDLTVSRLHITLRLEGTHFRIFDESSTSGTWVNDQRVPTYGIQLLDGDEIHMGAVHLRYHNDSE